MIENCGQLCTIDLSYPHDAHWCQNSKCPYECFFNDGKGCCSLNHFHYNEISDIALKSAPGKLIKPHLCYNSHSCPNKCQSKGICSSRPGEGTYLTYKNEYNPFSYYYVSILSETNPCEIQIDSGLIEHINKRHFIGNLNHTCDERCPDCNCFCDLWP